ncbi:hypothetical protein ONE63_009518 [Megalurothrips usitatus]|uniref:Reverse transcriptase domain-containing protein n=1 Tax=Megalurothrips usitatus TaxID=439358 RepID=A0AAV7XPM0_9NEOP|nr:hypothetical protein ONE63_009518 [Megalurothrips usitatus]
MITGVLQGSVLGPLLFLLYLHDLYKIIEHSSFHLYADVVQLYIHFPSPLAEAAVTLLSDDINNLLEYFAGHNLMLNINKTQAQLRRNMPFLPTQIRELLVKSLIFPHIDYALPLLTNINHENLHYPQKAQNAAVRFISPTAAMDHITPNYVRLKIFKVDDRRTLKVY